MYTDNKTRYFIFVAVILLLAFTIFSAAGDNYNHSKVYKAKEATTGVAVDSEYFYAIGKTKIGKYSKSTGKRVAKKKLPFDISACKIVNGDLVLVSGSDIIWINPGNLEIIDTMGVGINGKVTWIDWSWDKWWIGSRVQIDKKKLDMIFCFDENWGLAGFWRYPKELEKITGGAWFGDQLYVAADSPEIYLIEIPESRVHVKIKKAIQSCFDGHCFTFERGQGKVYMWGIRKGGGTVARCELDLDE